MRPLFAAAIVSFGALLPAAQAGAGVLGCAARAEIAEQLEQRYGEIFTGEVRRSDIGLMELFVAETGSWTILLTSPDGRSCPLAVGSDAERDFKRSDLLGVPA